MRKSMMYTMSILCLMMLSNGQLQANNYVIKVEDVSVVLDKTADDTYTFQVPIQITPLAASSDDLFIVASYGGLDKKTSQRFSLGSTNEDQFERVRTEKVRDRLLRSEDHRLAYQLLSHESALSELTLQDQIVSEDNVLPIYSKDRLQTLSDIYSEITVKLQPSKAAQSGVFSDIFTLYLYKGNYTDIEPQLMGSAQAELRVTVPSLTDLKVSRSNQNSEDMVKLLLVLDSTDDVVIDLIRNKQTLVSKKIQTENSHKTNEVSIELTDEEIENNQLNIRAEIRDL